MKVFITTILMILYSFVMSAQNPEGKWIGICWWNDKTVDISLNMKYMGGQLYEGYCTETKKNKTKITFKIKLYYDGNNNSGIIKWRETSDINVYYGAKHHKFKNYLDFVDSLGWKPSLCMCDDNKEVSIVYDGTYNHLDTECTDKKVYWSVIQKRPKETIYCLHNNTIPIIIDTIKVNKNTPFTFKVSDFRLSDGDNVTMFRNNEVILDKVALNKEPIIFPYYSSVDNDGNNTELTWCAHNEGFHSPNTGEIIFIQDNEIIKRIDVSIKTGERARFMIISK